MYRSSDDDSHSSTSAAKQLEECQSTESETESVLTSSISSTGRSDTQQEMLKLKTKHRVDTEHITLWAETSIPKHTPINKPVSSTQTYKKLPRRYRKMHLRSHDDILQEQYDALKLLLDDKKNLSQKQLQEEHVSQTLGMIGNYRAMSKGARARGIIISRSLPQALRSPRSSISSTPPCRAGRWPRSSSRSSPDRCSKNGKRVSFKFAACSDRQSTLEYSRFPEKGVNDETNGHNYIRELTVSQNGHKKKLKKRQALVNNETHIKVPENSPRDKPGVYEDINGVKHSDNNLKRTDNPDIRSWLKEKKKLLRKEKKEEREKKKLELKLESNKEEERERRKVESEEKLNEWQKAKRKEALVRRKQKEKQQKFEFQLNSPRVQTTTKPRPKSAKTHQKKQEKVPDNINIEKPSPPSKTRPQSAPLRRPVKPQPVPLDTLIKADPELKHKLTNLEKQKKMKHRQSYDEWCKIKKREKRDMLKVMREQRQKLEKEISEETARIISEAARKRMDGIRYKGAEEAKDDKPQEEKKPDPASYPSPYSRRTAGSNEHSRRSEKERDLPWTKKTSMQTNGIKHSRNVEDKINPGSENPFRQTFKPPQLKRPKSKLEHSGINGPEFAEFIWQQVNEEAGSRPEPQGADSTKPSASTLNPDMKSNDLNRPPPSRSPVPPKPRVEGKENTEPVIETGKSIFSMTSIE